MKTYISARILKYSTRIFLMPEKPCKRTQLSRVFSAAGFEQPARGGVCGSLGAHPGYGEANDGDSARARCASVIPPGRARCQAGAALYLGSSLSLSFKDLKAALALSFWNEYESGSIWLISWSKSVYLFCLTVIEDSGTWSFPLFLEWVFSVTFPDADGHFSSCPLKALQSRCKLSGRFDTV
jgi:hypothetical protein